MKTQSAKFKTQSYSLKRKACKFLVLNFGFAFCILSFAFIGRAAPLFPPQGQVQLILSPEFPEPNQIVTVTARSFSFDPDVTFLSWTYNGSNVASGKGIKTYSFHVGPTGSLHRISVSASAKGTTFSDTMTFRVSDILVAWEAQTYTPPGYRGKALPTSGALVRVHALPQLFISAAQTLNPDNLVYQWKIDDQDARDQSGRGKTFFSFRVANGRGVTHRVSVIAESEDKTVRAFAKADIRVEDPQILFYEDKTLEGPRYERAAQHFSVAGGEETRLRAEPFFFLRGSIDALNYQWRVDGRALGAGEKPRQFLLRTEQGSIGSHHVSLDVENPFQLFQRGNGSVIIEVK